MQKKSIQLQKTIRKLEKLLGGHLPGKKCQCIIFKKLRWPIQIKKWMLQRLNKLAH